MKLVKEIMEEMSLKEEFSRIDIAEHPFTIRIGTNDTRITTNFRDNPLFSFGSSMHEAGHALYELGLPEEHQFNVLCDSPSTGLHESQSRFWENMIGKNKPFWKRYFKKFSQEFNLGEDFEQWFREVNEIFPGKIRIESDEIHYCLHIIMRSEIEIGLIEGTIDVKDLPEIWNKKMKEYFDVTPKNMKEGVLQDMHWSDGSFGYFPTYALGSIYAAQIYEAIEKDFPEIEKDIEKGNYSEILLWLRKNIHYHGRKLLAEDIIKNITGSGLNVDCYLNYLNNKYQEIYKFE